MSQRSLDRIKDTCLWFHENKDRGRDYETERAFVHKTLDLLLELTTHLLEDIQTLEGKPRDYLRTHLVWTPSGVTARRRDE